MFDIFEESFLPQLIEFCDLYNKRLLSMLMLRTRHTMEAHTLLKEILPKTKFVDTQRTLASLAEVNS